MKSTAIFKHREDLEWKKIENEVVLIDDAEGKVFRFDPVASEIWSQLNGKNSFPDIVQHLTEVFEVTSRQAQKDTEAFLKKLSGLDLIQKVES